jgi:hypothetical protein
VLVECLDGHAGRDATENQLLKTCNVVESVPESLARRAALLRPPQTTMLPNSGLSGLKPTRVLLTLDPRSLALACLGGRECRPGPGALGCEA